jgi:hypothetical protein
MANTEPTAPIDPTERGSIARLLEAISEALGRHDIPLERARHMLGAIKTTTDAAAMAVRLGHRAHQLDRLTADLDAVVRDLTQGGE